MLGRRLADLLLFCVTATELVILFLLTPTFTIADWIYVMQHLLVLGVALTDGTGLFNSVQHGSYHRLRLSLRPSHLSSRVARLCGMARRRPRVSNLWGWFESCYASYFGENVWGPSGCKRSGDQWTLQIRPPPDVSLVHSGRHGLQPGGMESCHAIVDFGRLGGSRLPHSC